MKTFAALCLASTILVAPAALAQTSPAPTTPPSSTTSTPPTEATEVQTTAPGDVAAQDPQTGEPVPDVSGPGSSGELEDIVVVGRNIPNIVRSTPEVVSVLSAADIARTGEGDIAGALQRVTGLSVVGNGFVFVRGLGDRYSSSLLNGSPLPSPEPLRRVVPLDIFPTNVIASSLVQKSYSANYPGEFGGGVINLTTLAVPKESFLQIGGGISADTETTSELGYVYDGGRYDTVGYDSGERRVPGFIRRAGQTGAGVTNAADLISLSNAPTTLLLANYHLPPNWSGDTSFGTSFDYGSLRLGVIGSAGINNGWRTREALQQVANSASGGLQSDRDTVLTDNRVIVNGLIGFGAEFGRNKIRFTNLYIHDTLKQGRLSSGFAGNLTGQINGRDPLIQQNTNWFERQLVDSQLVGEFKFGDLSVDLRGSYANTKRKSPYERAFTYEYSTIANDYVNNLAGNSSASVAFSDLNEDLWSGQADLSYNLNLDRPVTLSAGYYYQDTQRESSRYSFEYRLPGNSALNVVAAQQRPDYLLSDSTIQRFGIGLVNTSANQGVAAYDADLTINAGYGQIEAEPLDGLRMTAGVRYEDGVEVVRAGAALNRRLANNYWLPAATFTWNFAADQQIRFHVSKTIARPQFRELAPQLYQDFESDRLFYGNPFLNDSVLWNAEARYEWFFARDQRITVAGFYKRIDDPIEAVASFPTNESPLQTGFANAPQAKLYGAEFEVQKYFGLNSLGDFFATKRLLVIANYTYTQSEISAGNELVADPISGTRATPLLTQANLLFRDGAPLVGQSDHLVNFQLGVEDTDTLSQITVLVNYASDRVTNRGAVSSGVRLPDLVERPGARLDVVARQGFSVAGADLELKLEARNLTKTRYQEFQTFDSGRVFVNRYDLGRIFSAGLSAKF
ncbi:Outer membrane receptor proteins, mostly Fe transport [Sphingomonas guangdongensis]|uniref:Outer membrane receptor proteins, mostly Fe transport n=1 Tax=Sphingomonas guangdongensis TaxID=1141890 RepID=A0A285QYN2_9SPHN|nr:TonB-dependent receptor [Sphingomonas guangdongensis]SOB86941.1 Outer membrane receptor proteins, mostly Fe transport [Sphingomonas guangdongensis]